MIRIRIILMAMIASAMIAGCFMYEPKWTIPIKARSIFIGPFQNRTEDAYLDEELNERLAQAFNVEGTLSVVDNEEEADLSLYGHIQIFNDLPFKWDEFDVPYRYRMQLVIDLMLYNNETNEALWTTHDRVQLTPTPVGGNKMDYDSLNFRSLTLILDYDNINSSRGVPRKESSTVRQEMLDLAEKRILERVFTGF